MLRAALQQAAGRHVPPAAGGASLLGAALPAAPGPTQAQLLPARLPAERRPCESP